ncbi:uncharacterized protein MELLADRAFT_59325 [Melampsora larici-populina 98AG31]|uniref:Uncharacterized protein n=1 Tax=Melampsora larici-populina (strain 98AG31 / pathotype 3-4-7) TaxID=747676 RepID=F4R5W7_MELLP|nr:uncharacterized protein MELLADRAFT_59325 [Melampsora larici-populina 98AG31]EGG12112.1 hypothetical protein MELLADRAFT_59325 [Melampsora larici-populina 98AG31]
MHKSNLVRADVLLQETVQTPSELNHKTKSPTDTRGGDSSTDEGSPMLPIIVLLKDSVEIMNYNIRSRCGLGHPHRPNPVDLDGNFTDFANKMVANNLIKVEYEPFASAFQSLSSSSEVADGFRSHRSARSVAEASKGIHKFRSRSPSRGLQNPVSATSDQLQSLPLRLQSQSASIQSFRDPVASTANQLQSIGPRHSSKYSAFGVHKTQHQSRLASVKKTFLDPASGAAIPSERRSPFEPGKKRHHFAPYPPHSTQHRTTEFGNRMQTSASRDINQFRSPPSIFATGTSDSKDLASEVTYKLQSHVLEKSASYSGKKQHQSRSLSRNHNLEKSNSISTQEIDHLYDPSPRLQNSGAFYDYPPSPRYKAISSSPSAVSKIPQSQSPLPALALEDSSSDAETVMAISKPLSQTNDSKISSSLVPGLLQQRCPQKTSISRKGLTYEGNVPSAAPATQPQGSNAEEKIENFIPSILNCHCRFSTMRSILTSGIGPLEKLLKDNTCNGYMYKETAHIFFRMFEEVRMVQDCVEHVHNCPNSVS